MAACLRPSAAGAALLVPGLSWVGPAPGVVGVCGQGAEGGRQGQSTHPCLPSLAQFGDWPERCLGRLRASTLGGDIHGP